MRGRGLFRFAAALAAGAAVALALSFAAPAFPGGGGDSGLSWLQRRAARVRREFARVLDELDRERKDAAARLPLAPGLDRFEFLSALPLDAETGGLAVLDREGGLVQWRGNVVDPAAFLPADPAAFLDARTAPFVVRDKASVFLVLPQSLSPDERLVRFRRLAFLPPIRSSLLVESQFLPRSLSRGLGVEYWDFRDDVAGFEKIFARYRDEYVGRAGGPATPRTLFFPLRTQDGRIVATVTLPFPGRAARLFAIRNGLRAAFFLLALAAAGCLLAAAVARSRDGRRKALFAAGAAVLVAGMRALALGLAGLPPVRDWPVFSPAQAAVNVPFGLAASPADVFLSALAVAGLAAIFLGALRPTLMRPPRRGIAAAALTVVGPAAAAAAFAGVLVAVRALVLHSNVNLLRFSFSGSFLLLQAGLALGLGAAIALSWTALRAAFLASRSPLVPLALTVAAAGAIALLPALRRGPLGLMALAAAVLLALVPFALRPVLLRRREPVVLLFLAAVLLLGRTLEHGVSLRTRGLAEGLLRTTVTSQETWASFLMDRSFPELDRRSREIAGVLKSGKGGEIAATLWSATLMSEFNWYSSLELARPDGEVLSRFSLNVPRTTEAPGDLPPADRWTVVRRRIEVSGEDLDLLVGYRDWTEGGRVLGRALVRLSVDPRQLPFLYSANPYFELVRRHPLPSLDRFDLGFAVYGPDGRLLHNPMRIDAPLPPDVLAAFDGGRDAVWSGFTDSGRTVRAYYVRDRDRVYVFFVARPGLRTAVVSFLKLALLELLMIAAVGLPALLLLRAARVHPFRSFSNRVYGAFLAAALLPLLLFTVFTRDLFDRIFSDRYVREAAARADYARSLLGDYLAFQESGPEGAPVEDIAFWISATLDADVNLYRDGRLIASSRREFFDRGILPEVLDGETVHLITLGGRPFVDRRARIGRYAFHTLTVPFPERDGTLFLSLPFPLEREEAAAAASELIEFLLLLAVACGALVLAFSRGVRAAFIVPVRKLLAGTREVSLGNLEVVLDHRSRDEMATLIGGFNAMTRSLKAQQQELAEMSRMAAWAEMARKVAHEIKNPLTPIQLSAEHLLRVYEDRRGDFEKTLKESLSYIIGEVEALRRIAQDFMEIAREPAARAEVFDLGVVIEEMLRPFRSLPAERVRFSLELRGAGGLRAKGDPSRIRTALRNLVINALEAIPAAGGRVAIEAERSDGTLAVVVRDNGAGMDEATRARVFEPYYSTKLGGTGLGLPITRKIVEEHGGAIRIDSRPGGGTVVTVELPAAE